MALGPWRSNEEFSDDPQKTGENGLILQGERKETPRGLSWKIAMQMIELQAFPESLEWHTLWISLVISPGGLESSARFVYQMVAASWVAARPRCWLCFMDFSPRFAEGFAELVVLANAWQLDVVWMYLGMVRHHNIRGFWFYNNPCLLITRFSHPTSFNVHVVCVLSPMRSMIFDFSSWTPRGGFLSHRGTPKSSILDWDFPWKKPSNLGYPHLWNPPHVWNLRLTPSDPGCTTKLCYRSPQRGCPWWTALAEKCHGPKKWGPDIFSQLFCWHYQIFF